MKKRSLLSASCMAAALAATSAFSAVGTAHADEILLKNGNKLEGKARRDGAQVVIEMGTAEVRLDATEVASITPGKTRLDLYNERVATLAAKDAASQIALADWCKEQKLSDLEKKHLRAVLAIDTDHAVARERLGFIRYDEKWLTEVEYYKARGFVKVGNEWLSKEEIAHRAAVAAAEKEAREYQRTVSAAVSKMSSPLKARRAEGRLALLTYAEKISDTHLAEFAVQVASYYNEAWRAVKAEYASAKTEVRATSTTLKRPIPTITTSLGANSTPVTIQLPELAVISIRTTVDIPIKIELDDE